MKHCGVVTDRSWHDCGKGRYAGNGDTGFMLHNLFLVHNAQKRRIYSDEVPMAMKDPRFTLELTRTRMVKALNTELFGDK